MAGRPQDPYRVEVSVLAPGVHLRGARYDPFARYAIVCDAPEHEVRRRLERAVEQRQWHAVQGRDKPFEGILWQRRFEISPNRRPAVFAPIVSGTFTNGAQTVLEIQSRPRGVAVAVAIGMLLGAAYFAGVFLMVKSWLVLLELGLLGAGAAVLFGLYVHEARAAQHALQRLLEADEESV